MSVLLADQFRRQAKEQREASAALLVSPKWKIVVDPDEKGSMVIDPTNYVAVTVAQVTANVLDALADAVQLGALAGTSSHRQNILKRNAAIRDAAARGDWDEFDRLVAGRIDPQSTAGDTDTADPQ